MKVIDTLISNKLQNLDRRTLLHIAIEEQSFFKKKWFQQKLLRILFKFLSRKEIFSLIYKKNLWGETQSLSGPGSTLEATKNIRAALPELFKKYNIKIMLDIPCGDFNWMKHVDLSDIKYIGADIVDELILKNQKRYVQSNISFQVLDIIKDTLPKVDLILCRDCLVHLSYNKILKALKNIKSSGSKYLLTTTFPFNEYNSGLSIEYWRPLNLEIAPFYFPKPLALINENSDESQFFDKSLGLWLIEDL